MKNTYFLLILFSAIILACSKNDEASPSATGKGGSMARFSISGDYLYTVDNSNLNIFSISDSQHPTLQKTISVGRGIETIYPYKNHLFLGSQNGMFIYNNTDPANPEFISNYQHIFSCDPVVVNDDYAFITLRSGTPCRQGVNRLEVVDIRNLSNPTLVKTYDMKNPFGLGLDDNTLFVCDDGLKVYDSSDPLDLKLKKQFPIQSYDVIPDQGRLSVVGPGGFYQYTYNGEEVNFLSQLPLTTK